MQQSADEFDPESPNAPDAGREVPVCPHCFEPLPDVPGWQAPFCPNCAGPVTGVATTDPLGQAYSLGHVVRNAIGSVEDHPHPKPGRRLREAPDSPEFGRRLREAPDSTEDTIANSPKRSRIIKIGIFLIMLPLMLPVVLTVAFNVSSLPDAGIIDILNMIIAGGLILLFVVILWKTMQERPK